MCYDSMLLVQSKCLMICQKVIVKMHAIHHTNGLNAYILLKGRGDVTGALENKASMAHVLKKDT